MAEEALAEAERHKYRVKAGLESRLSNEADVWQLWRDFRSYLVANGRRPNTLRHYDLMIPSLLGHAQAKKVTDLTLDRIEAYKADRAKQGRSSRTINGAVCSLKTMLNWAVRYGRLAENPVKRVEYVKHEKVQHRRAMPS